MAAPSPALRLSLADARLTFAAAQGFPARPGRQIVETLEETGFVRTLGGVDIYIAVRARVPGMRRADLDAVVAANEAQVVPAARGCMYLVPRRDVPLALRVADLLSSSRAARDQEKAGIRPGEVEEVARAVLRKLDEGVPMTTDALRKALPAGTVRSLGEAGRKVGISSPLPGALRFLELEGWAARSLHGERLDSERYLWRAPTRSPFEGVRLPEDPIDVYAGLARIFFRGAGLGTLKEFAAWAGIPQRDAKAALQRLDLLPVAIEGIEEVHFLPAERRDLPEQARDAAGAVALLSFADNLIALHGGPALLIDAAHHAMPVPSWGGPGAMPLGEARHASLRSVLAEGKISGFWEYDPESRAIVHASFDALPAAARERLDAAADDLSRFLTEDVGHGRSFSLDTDGDLRQRAAQVRGLGAGR
jgi:hypothetical protein